MKNRGNGVSAGLLGGATSVWQQIEEVRHTYLKQVRRESGTPTESNPGRTPITQESMAVTIAASMNGERVPHSLVELLSSILHSSIERMVGKIAFSYTTSCGEDVNDLVQDCIIRIWRKLPRYEPDKAAFTTWVWRVSTNVLNRKYRRCYRRNKAVIPSQEAEGISAECVRSSVMSGEIKDAIRGLADKFSDRRRFIYALFGDPDAPDHVLPTRICVTRAAEKAGIGRGEASSFYKRHVRGHFKSLFG